MTTPVLGLTELTAAPPQPHLVVNEALRILEAVVQIRVLDKDLNAPPGGAPEGARYIVGPAPSGAWLNQSNNLAVLMGGAWIFITPESGWRAYVTDESLGYEYGGSPTGWNSVASNLPAGGTTGQVLKKQSNADFDVDWETDIAAGGGSPVYELPPAGATGQVLAKVSSADFDVEWITATEAGDMEAEIAADTPLHWWKCDDAVTSPLGLVDSGGASPHVTMRQGAGTIGMQDRYLIPTSTKLYAKFTGVAASILVIDSGIVPPLSGDYTIECCAMVEDIAAGDAVFLTLGASGETEAANFQLELRAMPDGDDFGLRSFWENSTGTDNSQFCGGTTLAGGMHFQRGRAYHLVLVKDGTANTVSFYINGVFVDVRTYTNEPTGGTSASAVLAIGNAASGVFVAGNVAYYSSKLTAARIAAHAKAGGFR